MAALKDIVAKRFLDDILGSVCKPGQWKVLVLDHLSTRIMSACCKMQDVMTKGVTLVESLDKSRQPLAHMEAIYILVPSEKTVAKLIGDFEGAPTYKTAHVFFLEKCSTSLFSKLGSSKAAKRIVSLQEANMAFLPYESKVFTLDYTDIFEDFYSRDRVSAGHVCERIADQLATVCAMMGEYPSVRYRSEVSRTAEIAEALQNRLDAYKAEKRELGSAPEKAKSQLIILDRGFDVTTPLIHELTYQAMVYDLLSIKSDVYSFSATTMAGDQKKKDAILDENDAIWVRLRHQHIADVSKEVSEQFQQFATKKKLKHAGDPDISIKDLARHIKQVPQYQKELSGYSLHIHLVDSCLRKFRGGINKLCKVEQDMAMGTDAQGDPVTDPLRDMMPCLFDRNIQVYDKMRLLMLYIIFKGGVSREDFMKLMQHSEIPGPERAVLMNLMHFGTTIITEERVKEAKHKLKRIDRVGENYELSRWVPLVKDVAEHAVNGRLDESYAPFIRKPRSSSSSASGWSSGTSASSAAGITTTSVRQRWNWIPTQRGGGVDKEAGPTIMIFIVGGMTYSEMRAIYEISKTTSDCEVIIGATHVLTPNSFLGQLKKLRPLVST
ncbi:Syntaxin-binding protein 1 [Geodia barretti]|uniref:Syntaxin-binding protein 1 n=1 Tax=Geodia barretti TaxID=519541 RepID=A0AA35RAW9_GEOBA|nr:Syntaxin-binding protein 1 [Geodia barretti]